MSTLFTYDDGVRVTEDAPPDYRRGAKACVIAVMQGRQVPTYRVFASGTVYTVEFEGGATADIEEQFLRLRDD